MQYTRPCTSRGKKQHVPFAWKMPKRGRRCYGSYADMFHKDCWWNAVMNPPRPKSDRHRYEGVVACPNCRGRGHVIVAWNYAAQGTITHRKLPNWLQAPNLVDHVSMDSDQPVPMDLSGGRGADAQASSSPADPVLVAATVAAAQPSSSGSLAPYAPAGSVPWGLCTITTNANHTSCIAAAETTTTTSRYRRSSESRSDSRSVCAWRFTQVRSLGHAPE